VYFAFDSDALSDAETSTLDRAVGGIGEHPEALVDVYGFADPTGPATYNLGLGQRRAEAVLRYLVARSPDALSRYAAVSFGEESLAAMTDGSGDAAQDRRVVVSLVRRVPLDGGESPTAENVSNR
jgi:peptidoglycan-associated lipoprotein